MSAVIVPNHRNNLFLAVAYMIDGALSHELLPITAWAIEDNSSNNRDVFYQQPIALGYDYDCLNEAGSCIYDSSSGECWEEVFGLRYKGVKEWLSSIRTKLPAPTGGAAGSTTAAREA